MVLELAPLAQKVATVVGDAALSSVVSADHGNTDIILDTSESEI